MGRLVDRMVERMKEEERIRCPHCSAVYDPYEMEDERLVSFWGSEYGEAVEVFCHACEREFYAHEDVRRTFKTGRTEAEASAIL